MCWVTLVCYTTDKDSYLSNVRSIVLLLCKLWFTLTCSLFLLVVCFDQILKCNLEDMCNRQKERRQIHWYERWNCCRPLLVYSSSKSWKTSRYIHLGSSHRGRRGLGSIVLSCHVRAWIEKWKSFWFLSVVTFCSLLPVTRWHFETPRHQKESPKGNLWNESFRLFCFNPSCSGDYVQQRSRIQTRAALSSARKSLTPFLWCI